MQWTFCLKDLEQLNLTSDIFGDFCGFNFSLQWDNFTLFMHDISPVAENMSPYTTIDLCCDLPCIRCWYYNVSKTLCGFLNIAFLAWICIMCVGSWVMVGAMLGNGWHKVGWWLVQCCVMVGAMLGHGWWNVGSWLVQCWVMVGTKLGHGWWNVGSWLVQCWVMVGSRLGHGWYNVGSWLVQCWVMVGIKLDDGWHNVG